jgi:xylan 1,4-beta-xylosidase
MTNPASYRNPVLPGFHADPSVCRVGDEYYLVTSTFEYFPGVPIFKSRDLVHWRLIGHCLTRASQLPLAGAKSSQGIFAPTIRHHDGIFYLVTTNMSSGGSFYVTARDPAGEWSEPVWLNETTWSMDPSLFFDDDGKVYYTRHGGGERGGVVQAELDLASGQLKSDVQPIWPGTGGIWPEGPHLFKIAGRYYLLISEGGTSYDHMLTVARADSPWGPFEPCPHNPILAHRPRTGHPIQATGHADLVQAQNGTFWLVLLGIRPTNGPYHHLGRETFLAPVVFDRAGWPVVNGGAGIEFEMPSLGLPPFEAPPAPPARDDFD